MDKFEEEYAKKVSEVIKQTINTEKERLTAEKNEIMSERQYFTDYFAELHDDEKRDILHNEYLDTHRYTATLERLTKLIKQSDSPYFAGLDFEEDESEDTDENRFYLGVNSIVNPEDGEYLVYDWRAPIASLYYEKEIGRASYEAPQKEIFGELKGKRRYIFKKGHLSEVLSLNMPSDDEMLLKILGSNSQNRMKTIIDSIQAEQHRIIRDFTDGCSVLQGCAGSGKSSIALHKTAYIMYVNRKELDEKKMVVLSPNEYFSQYISSVLPDLGENAVRTMIPENVVDEACANAMDFDYLNNIESKIYIESLKGSDRKMAEATHNFKISDKFRNDVLAYEKYLEKHLFLADDLYLDENYDKYVPAEEIQEIFDDMKGIPLFSRPSEVSSVICAKYSLEKDVYNEYICGVLNDMFATFSVSKLYRMMFIDCDFLEKCKDGSLPAYTPDKILWEDAAAIAVLTVFLYGEMFKTDTFYMVADEAQDFSPIFLELLNKRFRGSNMLFVGDECQKVFGDSGDYTENIKKIIKKRPFRTYRLDTNYRSTEEIMNFTNEIAGNECSREIKCIRNGENPQKIIVNYKDDYEEKKVEAAEIIKDYLVEMSEKGFDYASVICADHADCEFMRCKVHLPYEMQMNVKFLPVYLAKGLEFDAVAVFYNDQTEFDKSSLYTACTRAMHNLCLFELLKN